MVRLDPRLQALPNYSRGRSVAQPEGRRRPGGVTIRRSPEDWARLPATAVLEVRLVNQGVQASFPYPFHRAAAAATPGLLTRCDDLFSSFSSWKMAPVVMQRGYTGRADHELRGTTSPSDRAVTGGPRGARDTGEVRVPLTEERAEVRKETRQTGQVGIRKETDVETQHISQPVTRTRVSAEVRDIPPGEQHRAREGQTNLREGEVLRMPVTEEELVVDKRRQVTREAVLRTEEETKQEERDVQLRRERVEFDEEGDAEIEGAGTGRARRDDL
jgi:uncharacterized protein (TIGR02271 family)